MERLIMAILVFMAGGVFGTVLGLIVVANRNRR